MSSSPDGDQGHVDTSGGDRGRAVERLRAAAGTEVALDRLAELAARLVGAPSAQLCLFAGVHVVAGSAGVPSGSTTTGVGSLCAVVEAGGGRLVVADAVRDERVAHLAPVTDGTVGSYLGVPLSSEDGHVVGALCVFGPAARAWSQADVAVVEQLASAATAELELSALSGEYETNRVVLDLAVSAAGIGVFDLDVVTGALQWDDRLIAMFGYARETFDATMVPFWERVHPEDRPRVEAALQHAVDACAEYEAEYRIVLPDGRTRWIAARGRALCDERGVTTRVLGAALDTTAARHEETRTAHLLESMSVGFLAVDREWRCTYVNAEAERIVGRPRAELLGGLVLELFPAAVGSPFETHVRHTMATGEPATFDAHYPAPLDAWLEVRVWPGADGLAVYFLDITARRSAQEADERAVARAALLAEVAAALAEDLDAEAALAGLARQLVPALGEWCIATLVEEGTARHRRGLRDVGSWHADPALRELTEAYRHQRVDAVGDPAALRRALELREPVVVQRGAADLSSVTLAGPARELSARLAAESVVVLPLRGRGNTVGLLTLATSAARGPFSDADLSTLREVAAQAGLALDNARLHAAQRDLATELQRSLLTDLPEHEHLQVAARYVPAASGAEVGGDWYDSFTTREGSTSFVIGDVTGHDRDAAVGMAQIRNVLRGIGYAVGEPPAAVLGILDASIRDLGIRTLTTAVLATVDPSDRCEPAGARTLRWSNAGHPPPLLLHRDGWAEFLTARPDLLLGLTTGTDRQDHERELVPGDTVVLYTDGLVERRGEHLDVGLERLRTTCAASADLGLEALCDDLLERLGTDVEDDVAVLAIRVER